MEILLAKAHDIHEITDMLRHAVQRMNDNGNYQWDTTYPNREIFTKDIEQGHLFKVESHGQILGVVCLNRNQSPEYLGLDWLTPKTALVIHRMLVAPEALGKGVAKMMFAFAEEEAVRQGLMAIRTDTNRANTAMNHLFKRFKYRFTGNIVLRNNPVLFNCYEKLLG